MPEVPDSEFVDALRAAVQSYLDAVDRWEDAYRKYYRMPGSAPILSSDMEAVQRDYEAQRRALEPLLPRAHRLCLKHGLQNPLPGLLRISLGGYAPQQRIDSAIGRRERSAVTECLIQLADACSGWTPQLTEEPPRASAGFRFSRRSTITAGVLGALTLMVIAIGRWRAPSERYRSFAKVPSAPARLYLLEGRPLTSWGDYNDILQHGMISPAGRTGGLLNLERTGPYIPPITFPGIGNVVVSAAGRKLLEESGLRGFGFRPVRKARIVELRWQDWDLTAHEPRMVPKSGEPEDYILELPPDGRAAEEMGDVWELLANGADFVRTGELSRILVTERAKAWLEEHLGGYVRFDEFSPK